MHYSRLILASLSFFASSLANNLHVIGTFDFNNNGKSEILKINGVGAPLEFVELDPSGNHTTFGLTLQREDRLLMRNLLILTMTKFLSLLLFKRTMLKKDG